MFDLLFLQKNHTNLAIISYKFCGILNFVSSVADAFVIAISHLHVRWENGRYERSRWMLFIAMMGMAIQYAVQMAFGFRAAGDDLGAVVNIIIYTPCFTLISMGIYNLETTIANYKKMSLFCGNVGYCIYMVAREMVKCKNMLETMAATDTYSIP